MTTTIKVLAHCNPETTVVEVVELTDRAMTKRIYVKDGETFECNIWDTKGITVREVLKPE
jgi:hypothetical protein